MEIQKINEILRMENQCTPSLTMLWKKLYAFLNPQQLKEMYNEKESFLSAFLADKQIKITSAETITMETICPATDCLIPSL